MTIPLKRRLPAVVLLSLTVCALVRAPDTSAQDAKEEPDKKAPEANKLLPPTEYKDLVFMASDRPVLIRLHLHIDGKPHYEKFFEYFKELFAQLDHNKDGVLTKEEVDIVPHPQFLQRQLQGDFDARGRQKVTMNDLDTNKDGKVSVAEFTDYYRRNNFKPLQLVTGSVAVNTERINDAILKHLGIEKDGKLSQKIIAKAPEVFLRLDKNEDELITADEIAPPPNPSDAKNASAAPGNAGPPQAPPETGVIDIQPDQPFDGPAKRLLGHYGKDKDDKLSRTEIGLDKELFDRLDANKDGHLDKAELVKFFQRDPDLELIARLGKLDAQGTGADSAPDDLGDKPDSANDLPSRIEVFNPKNRPMPLAAAASQMDETTLSLKLGDATLELRTVDDLRQRLNRFQNDDQFLLERFRELDLEKMGVLAKKQVQPARELLAIFDLANRAGDGKLSEKELKDFLELQFRGANCITTVQGTDQGCSLFDLFDADHNGRLSARELRTVWTRVQPLLKAKDGTLTKPDVPRRLTFALGQGQKVSFASNRRSNRPSSPAAPLWFTRMDRNNDGDLSPSEFLGSEEEFRMLDADGDGLISAEEARQWEAKQKKVKQAGNKEGDKKP
jgi:Ca2+-binding EF-hand superfamily protein